jgi:hypothetical protein
MTAVMVRRLTQVEDGYRPLCEWPGGPCMADAAACVHVSADAAQFVRSLCDAHALATVAEALEAHPSPEAGS